MKFIADTGDRRLDVTECVKMMYDALIGSMDWGSEFLDTDTKEAILAIGHLLGAPVPEPGRDHAVARHAGFAEPQPVHPGGTRSGSDPLLQEWADRYRAWQERLRAACMKWQAEVAAQSVARLREE